MTRQHFRVLSLTSPGFGRTASSISDGLVGWRIHVSMGSVTGVFKFRDPRLTDLRELCQPCLRQALFLLRNQAGVPGSAGPRTGFWRVAAKLRIESIGGAAKIFGDRPFLNTNEAGRKFRFIAYRI